MTDRPRATIHYTPTGIPIRVTGGGTTRTRLNARERRRHLRLAESLWAVGEIDWVPDADDKTVVWARYRGWSRGWVVQKLGGWVGFSDYTTGGLRADGSLFFAKERVERAICRALGAA